MMEMMDLDEADGGSPGRVCEGKRAEAGVVREEYLQSMAVIPSEQGVVRGAWC